MEGITCPVCGTRASSIDLGGGPQVQCPRCGEFSIGDIAQLLLSSWSLKQRGNLSAWIRENPGCILREKELKSLFPMRTPTVGEKADKLLLWLAKSHPKAGTKIEMFNSAINYEVIAGTEGNRTKFNVVTKPEMLARSWAQDDEELLYLVLEYLIKEKRYLEFVEEPSTESTPPDGPIFIL